MVELHVLHGPYVAGPGACQPIPAGAERLTVLVALRGPIRRSATAALLWPEADPHRAAGNLRSAAWRLRAGGLSLIGEANGDLALRPEIDLDLDALDGAADERGRRRVPTRDLGGERQLGLLLAALHLLPGWYDDWLAADRDRIRGRALAALERRADQLCRAHRWAEAIDTALIAVTADPLRESSQRTLVAAHLGDGNLGEARRAYLAYRAQLHADLDQEPSPDIAAMVGMGTRASRSPSRREG